MNQLELRSCMGQFLKHKNQRMKLERHNVAESNYLSSKSGKSKDNYKVEV